MRKIQLLLLLFVLFGNSSCDKKKNDSSTFTSYPLSQGNSWTYNLTTNSSFSGSQNITVTFFAKGDTTINSIGCTQIVKTDNNLTTGISKTYSHYYYNSLDGFYFLGGDSLAAGPLYFKTDETDYGIFVCDTPLQLLKFPIALGTLWGSKEYGGQYHFKRKYLGTEQVNTPAGTFNCTKLQAFFDFDDNGIQDSATSNIFQWYCNKGLVKEDYSSSISATSHTAVLSNVNF